MDAVTDDIGDGGNCAVPAKLREAGRRYGVNRFNYIARRYLEERSSTPCAQLPRCSTMLFALLKTPFTRRLF